MPSFEVTVQCKECNCSNLYETDSSANVGDDWPDPCTDCGTKHGNEIISVDAYDD